MKKLSDLLNTLDSQAMHLTLIWKTSSTLWRISEMPRTMELSWLDQETLSPTILRRVESVWTLLSRAGSPTWRMTSIDLRRWQTQRDLPETLCSRRNRFHKWPSELMCLTQPNQSLERIDPSPTVNHIEEDHPWWSTTNPSGHHSLPSAVTTAQSANSQPTKRILRKNSSVTWMKKTRGRSSDPPTTPSLARNHPLRPTCETWKHLSHLSSKDDRSKDKINKLPSIKANHIIVYNTSIVLSTHSIAQYETMHDAIVI